MTKKSLTVVTYENGTKTVEEMPLDAATQATLAALQAAWKAHGCKCKKPHRDRISIIPRGHSVDVICTDCGGWRQIG